MATKKARRLRISEKKLPKPKPDLATIFEFPATTVPPLRGLGEGEISPEISKRQDVIVRDLKPALTQDRIAALQNSVSRASAVKKLLGDTFIPVGVRTLHDEKKSSTSPVVMFYSYSNQLAIEATVDGRGRVTAIDEFRHQPAATDGEIQQAIALARRSLRKHEYWTDDLSAGVIAITNDEPTSPDYGRRLMDVRFFKQEERLATLKASVDLGKGRVISSGAVLDEGGEQ
jgi:hypothetical protein